MSTDRPGAGAPTTREDGLGLIGEPRRAAPTTREGGAVSARPAARTTREDGTARRVPAPTTQEGGSPGRPAAPTSLEHAGDGGYARVNLPPALADEYDRVGDIEGVGAEADLILCRRRSDSQLVVVKLYRRLNVAVDEEMLERVRTADHEHFVRLLAWGGQAGLFWEIMEYIEEGSLADLAEHEGPSAVPLPLLREILDEVAPALEYLHGMRLVHRDVKPSNILVRTTRPLDLVLSDFGLTVAVAQTREMRSGSRTQAYAAPEAAWGDTWAGLDWWSLGITLLELATGRHPFRHPDGRWLEDAQINTKLSSTTLDVSEVPDERWQRLLRGLLTADRSRRWGSAQVEGWRRGEDPEVYEAPPGPRSRAGDVRPFAFEDEEHASPQSLAAHMAREWHASADLVLGRGLDELEEWLTQFDRPPGLDEAVQACRARRLPVDRLVAQLIVQLSPTQEPTFQRYSVLRPDLARLAARAVAADGPERTAVAVLQRSRALEAYAELPRCAEHHALDERWQRLMAEAERRITAARVPLLASAVPTDILAARLLHLLVEPGELRGVQQAARRARRRVGDLPWFRELARPATDDLQPVVELLAAAAQPVAAEQLDERKRREDDEKAERRRSQADQRRQQEELQRQAEFTRRTSAAARRRWRERRLGGLLALVLVTAWVPYQLGRQIWDQRMAGPVPRGAFWVAVSPIWRYVPEYIFGACLILGAFGVVLLLLPPWSVQTLRRLAVAAVLVVLAAAAPLSADRARTAIIDRGRQAYTLGPVPLDRLGSTCGTAWTGSQPVAGSIHRYVLVGARGAGGGCRTLRAYRGWATQWSYPAASNAAFTSLASYSRFKMLVARLDVVGHPNVLVGINQSTGKVKWRWSCRKPDARYLTGEVYHGMDDGSSSVKDPPYVQVSCAEGTEKISPANGARYGR